MVRYDWMAKSAKNLSLSDSGQSRRDGAGASLRRSPESPITARNQRRCACAVKKKPCPGCPEQGSRNMLKDLLTNRPPADQNALIREEEAGIRGSGADIGRGSVKALIKSRKLGTGRCKTLIHRSPETDSS